MKQPERASLESGHGGYLGSGRRISPCLTAISVHTSLSRAVHPRGRTAGIGQPLKPSLGRQQRDGGQNRERRQGEAAGW